MKNDKYLSWHYYPLHLSQKEILNPSLVIKDFFSFEWLPGQLALLKKWRGCVIGFHYFKGAKGNPATLFHIYRLNLSLIEAVFLLDCNRQNYLNTTVSSEHGEEQILAERACWRDYPTLLNKKQLLDPFKVLRRFCKWYSLPDYRDHLDEWLSYGLSIRGCGEFIESCDLINVYENLQLLYEACWLIHMRLTEPVIRQTTDNQPAHNIN